MTDAYQVGHVLEHGLGPRVGHKGEDHRVDIVFVGHLNRLNHARTAHQQHVSFLRTLNVPRVEKQKRTSVSGAGMKNSYTCANKSWRLPSCDGAWPRV